MKRFTGHTEDWGTFVDVKHCDKPLNVKKLTGKSVYLSSVTDCYNQNDLYKAIYTKGDKSYWTDLAIALETYCTDNDIPYVNFFYHEELVKAKLARQAEEKPGAAVQD